MEGETVGAGVGVVVTGFAVAAAGVATRSSELPPSSEESVSLSFQGFPPGHWLMNMIGKLCFFFFVCCFSDIEIYIWGTLRIGNVQNMGT